MVGPEIVHRNWIVSPSAVSSDSTTALRAVSECPLAGTSLAVPPELPSEVQLALVVSGSPVSPVKRVVEATLLAKVDVRTEDILDEVVVILFQPAEFLLY